MSGWYSKEDLKKFASCGENVLIDESVKFLAPEKVNIGSNVRIDSWCLLSAFKGITIGDHVHIAASTHLIASGGPIEIHDFVGISARVNIFTGTDDYSEGHLTNPTIPDEYKKVKTGPVVLQKHVIVGCGSVIMPKCVLKTGSSVGALSFVNKSVPEFTVVGGNPIRVICKRDKDKLMMMERKFLDEKARRNSGAT